MVKFINRNFIVISCFLSACLEMYDFIIFGFLYPVLKKEYLSFLTDQKALVVTYLIFAVGFVFRPLGSAIFGHIGDRYGRKIALIISVTIMGAASLCMGLLPPYTVIGVYACYIIAFVRILQGISIGGEHSGAILYAMEHMQKNKVGFVGAVVLSGATLGILLAIFVSKLVQSPFFPKYSWRFAFFIGFTLSVIGYFIRKKLAETPKFREEKSKRVSNPLIYGFKNLKKQLAVSVLLAGAANANFYYVIIFLPEYLQSRVATELTINNVMFMVIIFITTPFAGYLSDKYDRNKMLIIASAGLGIYNLFFLPIIITLNNNDMLFIYTSIYAILLSFLLPLTSVYVLEIFPVNCRFSCSAFSYSIGAAFLGGIVPFMCVLISKYFPTNPEKFISYYISFTSFLGAVGCLMMFNSNNKSRIIKRGINANRV